MVWRGHSSSYDIEPLAEGLPLRKYSKPAVEMALHSILNLGLSVTQASIDFKIKRTTLQHYLKRLNIKMNYNTRKSRNASF